ncbi:MAG: FG-GAP-like repeat-containing protein [Chloroflexota bacterium]
MRHTAKIEQKTHARRLFLSCSFALISLFLLNSTAYAQAYPPLSVTDGLMLWLDADDTATLYSDSACTTAIAGTARESIACWQDKSGNDADVTQRFSSRHPVYVPSFINNRGAIDFDKMRNNEDFFEHVLPEAVTTDASVFIVLQSDDPAPHDHDAFFSTDNSTSVSSMQIDYGKPNNRFRVKIQNTNHTAGFGTFEPHVLKLYATTLSGSQLETYSDGLLVESNTIAHEQVYIERFRVNRNRVGNRYHDSKIAEILVYDRILTPCEFETVNLYLGVKYGRDFLNMVDYYDYRDTHGTYVNALGHLNLSCDDDARQTTAVSGIAVISNPSDLGLGELLTFGHDDAGYTASDNHPAEQENRLSQVWRVDKDDLVDTDGVGTVTVEFMLDQLPDWARNRTNFALLVDADGDFSNATAVSPTNTTETVVTFEAVDFVDGDYFTLAYSMGAVESFNSTPYRTSVAFEDLKGAGWSDWDYNDFVVQIEMDIRTAVIAETEQKGIAEILLRYDALARGAGFGHAFHHAVALSGGGYYELIVRDTEGGILKEESGTFNGGEFEGGDFTIFENTFEAVPGVVEIFGNTHPDQTALGGGYTAELRLFMSDRTANVLLTPRDGTRVAATRDARGRKSDLPWDPYIFVHNTGEEVHLVQPGQSKNKQRVVPTGGRETGPLTGYDLSMAYVFDETWHWPEEFSNIWESYPRYVNFITTGGNAFADWFQSTQGVRDNLWLFGHRDPNIGLGGEGRVTASSRWSSRSLDAPNAISQTRSRYVGGTVVTRLYQSGEQKDRFFIIAGNITEERLEVFDETSHMVEGWPQPVIGGIKSAVTIVNIDDDDDLEILVTSEGDVEDVNSDGLIYAFNPDGSLVDGWPVEVTDGTDENSENGPVNYRVLASTAATDLDEDGQMDMIIVPSTDGKLYAYNGAGESLSGWPISIGEEADQFGGQSRNATPIFADVDGDGTQEIVIGSHDNNLYVFDLDGNVVWTFETEDTIQGRAVVADIDPETEGNEVVFGSGDAGLYMLDQHGTLLWMIYTDGMINGDPLVRNIDGDTGSDTGGDTGNNTDLEILIGSQDHNLYAFHHTGEAVFGWPQLLAAPIVSSPQMGDVDGDGTGEILVGGSDAAVYAYEFDGTQVPDWPKYTEGAVEGTIVVINMDDDVEEEVIVGDIAGGLYYWNTLVENKVFLPYVKR